MFRHHGAYYLVRRNKWIRLGDELGAAIQEYTRRIKPRGGMDEAISRALAEIRTRGASSTVKQYGAAAKKLQPILAEFTPADIRPVHIHKILDHMRATPNMANRCRSFLLLTMRLAVGAGECDRNPVTEVDPLPEHERERYITDAEFAAIYDAAPPVVQIFMSIAYLTGQRISDVLKIKHADLVDDGIGFRQQKTGARLIVKWSPELREAVQRAKSLRQVMGFWLICKRNGKPYSYKGMRDAFERARAVAKVLDVTPHDVRAKSATDAKKQGLNPTLLLGHTTQARTDRYIRQRLVDVVEGPRFLASGKKSAS